MAGQQYLPLPGWINARINDSISRGADVRLWLANPLERVRVPYSFSDTQYSARLALDPGIKISGAPIPVDDINRPYWLLVLAPGQRWYTQSGGEVREDGQIAPQAEPYPAIYRPQGFGFAFDPNEPAKEWAGFQRAADGTIVPIAPQSKSHRNEALAIGVGLFASAVVAGEYLVAAAASSGSAAPVAAETVPAATAAAPTSATTVTTASTTTAGAGAGAGAVSSVGQALSSAAGAINTTAATAANVVGAAAAVKGAWTDPEPKPAAKPPADNTDWMMYAAVAAIGVLLLTQGKK